MTSTFPAAQPDESRKGGLKLAEIIGLSAALALFVGLTVLLVTHDPILALIAFGIVLVLSLIGISLLRIALKPDAFDRTERHGPASLYDGSGSRDTTDTPNGQR